MHIGEFTIVADTTGTYSYDVEVYHGDKLIQETATGNTHDWYFFKTHSGSGLNNQGTGFQDITLLQQSQERVWMLLTTYAPNGKDLFVYFYDTSDKSNYWCLMSNGQNGLIALGPKFEHTGQVNQYELTKSHQKASWRFIEPYEEGLSVARTPYERDIISNRVPVSITFSANGKRISVESSSQKWEWKIPKKLR